MPQPRKRPPPKAKTTCKLSCCTVTDARKAEIAESVAAGRGRSMFDTDDATDLDRFHGVMCRCGVPRKPSGLARHVEDDGVCFVHPDGPPQGWVRGAGGGDGTGADGGARH